MTQGIVFILFVLCHCIHFVDRLCRRIEKNLSSLIRILYNKNNKKKKNKNKPLSSIISFVKLAGELWSDREGSTQPEFQWLDAAVINDL
jgi:hypothetical protein